MTGFLLCSVSRESVPRGVGGDISDGQGAALAGEDAVGVEEDLHGGLRHLGEGLLDRGAGIAPGGVVGDAVIADDLHLTRDIHALCAQMGDHARGEIVRVAEDAVEVQLSVVQMLLQKAVDRRLGLQIAQAQARVIRAVLAALVLKALTAAVRLAPDLGADAHRSFLQPRDSSLSAASSPPA